MAEPQRLPVGKEARHAADAARLREARQIYMWQRLDAYWDVLQRSQLAEKSIEDYYYFAEVFVRWMEGSFTPGSNLRNGE